MAMPGYPGYVGGMPQPGQPGYGAAGGYPPQPGNGGQNSCLSHILIHFTS